MPYSTDCNSGPSEFPESIVTVTLEFGPYLRADGSPVAQPISITPSVEVLDIDSGAVIMALRPVTLRASQTRVILPATDSPGLLPIDFTYQVTVGGVPKVVSLPMAHPVVDFDLLVSSEPSPGTIIWHPPTLPSGGGDGDVLAWADVEDGGTRWMSPGEWPGVQRAEEAAQQAGEAAQQAEDARDGMVVGGTVDGDDLLLSTVGGDTIVAGNVRGQKGDPGTASPEFLAGVQAAQDARAGAEEARDEAEQSASQADASKTGAETAQGLAVTARTGAETARTGAETARTGAEQARDEAETAQGLAEDARDAAQAANATTVATGEVVGDDLILTRTDATTVNAGNVRGATNSLAIGTVTTLDAGSSATASVTGEPPSQTLNLGIPRGATGATGAVSTWEYYAAGRPDVVGTLDAAALAWRNAAPSGSTFYSTNGPQGAWVWRKRGGTWVCVEGDTGWVALMWWDSGAVYGDLPAGVVPNQSTRNVPGGVVAPADRYGAIEIRMTPSERLLRAWGISQLGTGTNRIYFPNDWRSGVFQSLAIGPYPCTSGDGFMDIRLSTVQAVGAWVPVWINPRVPGAWPTTITF